MNTTCKDVVMEELLPWDDNLKVLLLLLWI